MRRSIIVLALIAVLAVVPAQAANYYFDLASGDDTTGDGSAGTPWKTIDKCTTSRSPGDECRGAKTAITTLTGTLTFTNGSTTVTTSEDLSAVVAAGDVVGKNSGLEGWWEVASVGASSITLSYQYWGLSGSGDAVTGYKITPVAASELYDISTDGSSTAYLKVSGGWDLSTETHDGITAVGGTYTPVISFSGDDFVELSDFILIAKGSAGINDGYGGSTNLYLHDLWLTGLATTAFINFYSTNSLIYENVVLSGGTGKGMDISSQEANLIIRNMNLFSIGTGSGDYALSCEASGGLIYNLKSYNAVVPHIFSSSGSGVFINGCTLDTVRSASSLIYLYTAHNIRITSAILNQNQASSPINVAGGGYSTDNYIQLDSLTNAHTSEVSIGSYTMQLNPTLTYIKESSDSIIYFYNASIVHDSTAACRSGKCLKFLSSRATGILYKVGSVKVPSAATDLTMKAYIKDDASFNGRVFFIPLLDGQWLNAKTEKTPTNSYVQESIVVSSTDLVADKYLELYVLVTGTTGAVWVDDFSAEQ